MDEIQAIPRNRYLGMLADALRSTKNATGPVGDFLIGDAPRVLNQWSYGFSPVRMGNTDQGLAGAINGMSVDPGLLDVAGVAGMVPGVGRLGAWAGKEGLRAIDDAMQSGSGVLARALSGVQPLRLGSPIQFDPVLTRGMNIADISATKSGLPPVQDGMTRLYRGSAPDVHFGDVFDAGQLSSFLPTKEGIHFTPDLGYADYYRQSYGRNAKLSYIDVPTQDLQKYAGLDGTYILPVTDALNP